MESNEPGNHAISVSTSRRQWLRTTAVVTAGSFLFPKCVTAWTGIQSASGNSPSVQPESLQYPAGNSNINAFVSKPATGGSHPSLILIHDEAGLNDYAIQTASRFAEAGFYTFTPDLLSRFGGVAKFKSAEHAADALSRITAEQTAEDLRAGYSYLRSTLNPDAGASAVGLGWGGWRTFLLAQKISGLSRAVVYSASAPTVGLHGVETNFLAHYGQYDFRLAGNALWLEKQLGKRFTYFIYPGVDHGFFDDSGPQFNAEAAKLAWSRTLKFLRAA